MVSGEGEPWADWWALCLQPADRAAPPTRVELHHLTGEEDREEQTTIVQLHNTTQRQPEGHHRMEREVKRNMFPI